MAVFFICAGLIGVLAALLTLNVGRMRTKKRISLGDGGDPEMIAAIRAHGNLIEFAPLCLLIIWLLHGPYGHRTIAVLGVVLLTSRVLHAGGMLGAIPMGRTVGAVGTAVVLAVASIMLVLAGIRAL
ncbi:MAG: MAPEG family protein [Enhydrobacter sp.]|nr:MAPEG family protein [Enhydrobacter sp.]